MNQDQFKRRSVSLSPTSTAVLQGEADYSDWSDEELWAGRRKSKRGTWAGRPPTVVPMEMLHELARRETSKGTKALWSAVEDACTWLADVAAGRAEPDDARLRAVHLLLNRVWGQAPQQIQIEDQRSERPVMRTVVIRKRPEAIEAESREESDD